MNTYVLKIGFVGLFGWMFSFTLFAQVELPLYPEVIPNSKKADNREKNTSRPYGADWRSEVSVPTLTYYPVDGGEHLPAVIICPGGGYAGLSIVKEGSEVAQAFNRKGVAAFVLKYRLPDERIMQDKSIGPLQDAQTAIMVVRTNAKKWNIDPQKIGIAGFSAGGHLASTAGTHFDKPVIANGQVSVRPDFMILLYPVISFADSLTHMGSRENLIGKNALPEEVQLYSNELQVSDNTPKSFVVHAGDDNVVKVENSVLFYQALHRHHIPSELLLYPRGGHGFGLHNKTATDHWMEHCIQWMKSEGWCKCCF